MTENRKHMTDDRGLSLIWFHSRGCGSCRRQGEEYARNPPPLPLRRVDAATPEGCALMRRHGVGDAPTTVLVDGRGRTVKVWVGEVETVAVARFVERSRAWIDSRLAYLDAMEGRAHA